MTNKYTPARAPRHSGYNPLVFFGTEHLSAVILQRLIEAGYRIEAAVTKPDARGGRGKKLVAPEVKTIAEENNIPVLQPTNSRELEDRLAACRLPHTAILAAYGKIIPKSVLNLFPGGIINVHPSLLPRYRGPSPIESAILRGDEKTGVSLMKLTEAMDAGPVYAQREISLRGSETRPELYDTLAATGADLLTGNLPAILNGELTPQPQDETNATYCPLIKKADGVIDWHKPAEQLEREIRAYHGWPGSRTHLFGQDVTILAAEVENTSLTPGETHIMPQKSKLEELSLQDGKGLLVGAGGGKSLAITQLRPAGRGTMTVVEFLRGLQH